MVEPIELGGSVNQGSGGGHEFLLNILHLDIIPVENGAPVCVCVRGIL